MEGSFIDKIKQIVLDHLDDEKFGVKELSSKIGLSKSQLYRKVKSLTNKSINQLMKETRLEEAAKLILESDLHASEISYKVGFNSPSYFNKCFSKYYGITPGEYKEKYKDNLPINGFDQKTSPSGVKKIQTIIYILGAVLLFFGIYSSIKNKSFTADINSGEISVAVLYFDDHSSESDKQWFCSAITEEMTAKLSRMKRLIVIGRTSVKQYRNSNQSIPEIAEALGVDYVIEGSVAMDNNKVKITTQLIRANNEHVWYKEYNDSFDDLFIIQQNVAEQIVEQLKIDLSLEEEKRLNYVSTQNLEAFQLVSEGRSFADLVGVEYLEKIPFLLPGGRINLEKSVGLYEQAIFLDPNYSEAYAEMAFSLQLMWAGNKEIDSLIERSLAINPNTARAYTTKGAMQGYREGNWEKAKENFQKAIELEPNDATNQLYMAIYYALRAVPDYIKALEHINIAQKLNPHFYAINYNKIEYLLKNDKIVEAEAFYKDNYSFFTEGLKSKIQTRLLKAKAKKVSLEKKDWTEAAKFYDKEIEKNPQNPEIYRLLAEVYDEVLNDAPNFYKYAKLAYELDSTLAIKLNIRQQYVFKRTFMFSQAKNKKWKENYEMILGLGFEAPLATHFYMKGDYEKAEIYVEKYFYDNYDDQASLYAQQKKIEKTYEILNKGVLANYEKARVFAILKERDSMYYYINKEQDIYKIRYFNSYFEVDPYRKEERYKALLKKNNLPLTHWNE